MAEYITDPTNLEQGLLQEMANIETASKICLGICYRFTLITPVPVSISIGKRSQGTPSR